MYSNKSPDSSKQRYKIKRDLS